MPHPESGVQLAVGDVPVLALVQKQHSVEGQRLQVADEVGRHHGDEAPLRHDPGLDVVELQPGVGAGHVACVSGDAFLAPAAAQQLCRRPTGPRNLTFYCHVVDRKLQVLPAAHHFHRVPLIVIQLLTYQEDLGALAWEEVKGSSDNHAMPAQHPHLKAFRGLSAQDPSHTYCAHPPSSFIPLAGIRTAII